MRLWAFIMLSFPDFKEKQVILALLSHGEKLSFRNDNIIIKDKESKTKHQSSCYRLFALFVVGHTTITTGLLQRAKKFGFSIIFMSHSLKPYACWNAESEGNVLLRCKQYNYQSSAIARKLVVNKIHNQMRALQKIRKKDEKIKNTIKSLKTCKQKVLLANLTEKELLGIEGRASKIYFQVLFKDFSWMARRPRAKMDITNCLMDIGYTLLFNFIESLLCLYGFDIYKGVYHKEFYQRKSLVCDLIEPFRPLIDYRIRKAFHLGQINTSDFTVFQGQYRIFGKKSQPYLTFFIEELILHKVNIFLYIQSYYRSFIKDQPIDKYPFFDFYQYQWKEVA